MAVRSGREFLAIPGPTTMPDEVLRAMHRPALDIYSEAMTGMTDSLLSDLSKLFATKGRSYIYIANGHGAWEAALSNVLSRGGSRGAPATGQGSHHQGDPGGAGRYRVRRDQRHRSHRQGDQGGGSSG